MKKLFSSLLLSFAFVAALAAQGPPTQGPVVYQNYTPPGTPCSLPNFLTVQTSGAGAGLYQCLSSTWTKVGGGGATTPATSNLLKGTGVANGVAAATPGTDYLVTTPLYLNWAINSGVAATDAAPRFLASHTATIATCYLLTTASDGATALTLNLFDNGTTIFTAGAQTVAAGTAAGTLTTLGSLATTAITNNDKMSINITSGSSSWIFTVQCK